MCCLNQKQQIKQFVNHGVCDILMMLLHTHNTNLICSKSRSYFKEVKIKFQSTNSFSWGRQYLIVIEFCFLKFCRASEGNCRISVDGFYIECVICVLLGISWFLWKRKETRHLDSLDLKEWKVL